MKPNGEIIYEANSGNSGYNYFHSSPATIVKAMEYALANS